MQPVIQATNTSGGRYGRERILVDTRLVRKSAHSFAAFPGPGEPAPGRDHAREHRSGRDVARSPGHIGGLVTNRARWHFRRLSSFLVDRSGTTGPAAVTKASQQFARCPTRFNEATMGQLERTCHRSPPIPVVKQGGEIKGGVH